MRRHEKHACGGVLDVTLLPFLFFKDEEEVKSSSSVDTSILYTENCNVYTPPLHPSLKENTPVLCHHLFFLFVFVFVFRNRRQRPKKKKKKEEDACDFTTYYICKERTHAREKERTIHRTPTKMSSRARAAIFRDL